MSRPKVVRVTGASQEALAAAAAQACARHTAAPECERVLVVYGEQSANLYIESAPARRSPARRAHS